MSNAYRMIQRSQAIADRGGLCDLCGQPASEYHEIVSRGRTVKNEVARRLSYNKYICSLLCPACHKEQDNAHNPETANKLLEINIARYGFERVYLAWLALIAELRTAVNIEFPEVSEDEAEDTG